MNQEDAALETMSDSSTEDVHPIVQTLKQYLNPEFLTMLYLDLLDKLKYFGTGFLLIDWSIHYKLRQGHTMIKEIMNM